jgi:hypothetical protein
MEELRSTDVLDREILEDARKKAYKILKTADETVAAQTKRWDKKSVRDLAKVRKAYAERIEKERVEILARLPLDKRRLRSETAQNALGEAMDGFLSALGRDKLLSLLESELKERLAACIDWREEGIRDQAVLLFSAMSEAEAGKFAGMAKGCVGEITLRKNDSPLASKYPALSLDAPTAKIEVSVENAAANLLEDKRAELAAALLGGEVLND